MGTVGAVWDRCIVHGLFSAQLDMQRIQEDLRVLADGPPLQFEAGDLHLLSTACLLEKCNSVLLSMRMSGLHAKHSLIHTLCSPVRGGLSCR